MSYLIASRVVQGLGLKRTILAGEVSVELAVGLNALGLILDGADPSPPEIEDAIADGPRFTDRQAINNPAQQPLGPLHGDFFRRPPSQDLNLHIRTRPAKRFQDSRFLLL